MSFFLSKAVWVLLAPGNLLLAVLTLGVVLLILGRRRAGMVFTGAATLGFLAIAVLPVSYWLMRPLEARFPPQAELPAHVDGIIVLGGAVVPERMADWGQPSLNDSAERMTAMVELARRFPEARLVFTGGSGSVQTQELKEAPVARELWSRMGLDTDRIIFEDQSRNTWENALLTREIVKPAPDEVWLLVTSASHMPRSMGVFRQAGWDPVPYPVAFKTAYPYDLRLDFELTMGLYLSSLAVREWIGLVSYYAMGRTDVLFPAPGTEEKRLPAGP